MSAVDVDEILEHQLNANMLLMPYEVYAQLFDSVAELGDENAKLRELLSESLMDYKLYAKKYGLPPYLSDVNEHLDARMRELGVEVDG